jgi:hypothetical protein
VEEAGLLVVCEWNVGSDETPYLETMLVMARSRSEAQRMRLAGPSKTMRVSIVFFEFFRSCVVVSVSSCVVVVRYFAVGQLMAPSVP